VIYVFFWVFAHVLLKRCKLSSIGYAGDEPIKSLQCGTTGTKHTYNCNIREAEWLSEHYAEGLGLYVGLKGLFDDLTGALVGDPPLEVRRGLVRMGRRRLRYWLNKSYVSDEARGFIGKVRNGFDYWFTFVLVVGLEATNNSAERALKEPVVQRKIMGTLRNERGTVIYETMMSLLATWSKQGLVDTFDQMRNSLILAWTKS
jgi:hypothetical protein